MMSTNTLPRSDRFEGKKKAGSCVGYSKGHHFKICDYVAVGHKWEDYVSPRLCTHLQFQCEDDDSDSGAYEEEQKYSADQKRLSSGDI